MKEINQELLDYLKDEARNEYAWKHCDEFSFTTPAHFARYGILSKHIAWDNNLRPRKCYLELEKLIRRGRVVKHSCPGGYCSYWPLNEDGTPLRPVA